MRDEQPDKNSRAAGDSGTVSQRMPHVAFESIAQGSREVLIEYRGQLYRLRVTRNGKLILNK